ncbi:hypothetical protein EI77_03871 [Prosthecobacter fusiformis]|uniref:Uncharacterized protein n=1 Tax=Prosthecobacter fusiformis TaxID=48464 RepID=A0A4R7RLE7_9BACT|nr:hypothetical protein [Prosthecobacter fusiformis]TDU66134.1 hypothetical protein EI77_03871 [Prosthecobacter fusiformis]
MLTQDLQNPAERSMIISVRLWFFWPLACILFAAASYPFGSYIRVANSWAQWIYFIMLAAFAIIPLKFFCLAARSSWLALKDRKHRHQGVISIIMLGLAALIIFPLGLVIANLGVMAGS